MRAMLLALAACSAHDVVVGELQEVALLPSKPDRDLDLLFVVDNSPSMADKQLSLADNFPRMIDTLATLDGGLPNLHVGVVTSDMGTSSTTGAPAPAIAGIGGCSGFGDGGVLQHASASVAGAFISDVANPDGSRATNYTGALRDAFAEDALVGDRGCGMEQHLAAMRAALDRNPANAGFLRPGANLAVVILADEDDCSARAPDLFAADPSALDYRCTKFGVVCDGDDPDHAHADQTGCMPRVDSTLVDDVQPYAELLAAIQPDPRMRMLAAIAGPPAPFSTAAGPALLPSCAFAEPDGTQASARPAVRLAAAASDFTSICSSDLSGPLQAIGASAKRLVGDPCLRMSALADTCGVRAVAAAHPAATARARPCTGDDDAPCYAIAPDAAACPYTIDHLRVSIEHVDAAPDDTWFHVRCQVTP